MRSGFLLFEDDEVVRLEREREREWGGDRVGRLSAAKNKERQMDIKSPYEVWSGYLINYIVPVGVQRAMSERRAYDNNSNNNNNKGNK